MNKKKSEAQIDAELTMIAAREWKQGTASMREAKQANMSPEDYKACLLGRVCKYRLIDNAPTWR